MPPCKIILADDHEMFRSGLKAMIDKEAGFKVVAQAKDGEVLLSLLKSTRCNVIILDLSMPNMDGISALRDIHLKYPKIKVIVLTMQKDHEHFKYAMASGARGFILKEDAYEQLVLAIKTVLRGKQFVSSSVATVFTERYVRSLDEVDAPSLNILTRREGEILKLIANGLPNKNIASKLKISVRTVETHRANLANKLGLRNTASLVKYAVSKGLV
ncbi:MAG: hypothetical protein A2Z88_10100 [Omnitrophica WOR_2 bacterium GWA2_47_8]|nr:MAG: hypothetical protein A2Z88_10100 [Omnitrophica WOR_2 bacterium GWA2_47_8]